MRALIVACLLILPPAAPAAEPPGQPLSFDPTRKQVTTVTVSADSREVLTGRHLGTVIVTTVDRVLAIEPGDVDFGATLVDETSAVETVTLTNTGTEELTVFALDEALAPFALDQSECSPDGFSLEPEESCDFGYTFAPTEEGAFSQVLGVESDASTGQNHFELFGTGVATEVIFWDRFEEP